MAEEGLTEAELGLMAREARDVKVRDVLWLRKEGLTEAELGLMAVRRGTSR